MSRNHFRPNRSWSMSAAASAMLMVTSAAFAASDRTTAPAQGAQDTLFRQLDTDRDGLVSRAEAASESRLSKAFDAADENKDGKLTADEFIKAHAIRDRALAADYGRDSLITAKVKAALIRDPAVSGLGVGVKTYDGVVLLSGKVMNQAEADRVRSLARGVSGVVDVRDEFVMTK